jgi:epoxyqueuosine reductase
MTYLERQQERILDPRRILPGGATILVLGLAHSRAPAALPGKGGMTGGRIARYAAGRDYHNAVGSMLRKLSRALEREGLAGRKRSVVDAGPLLERSHAATAALGFPSKAANLLHPRFGPWFFLAEILLEEDVIEDSPPATPPPGSCGTCTACLDACPTGAIVAPFRVDARRCISYHTIENRGHVPHEMRELQGEWVFGCDVCSEVCPWGKDAPDLAERFGLHPSIEQGSLAGWIQAGDSFKETFRGSPLQRPGRAGLARNAAIALGNEPGDGGSEILLHALSKDADAVVREACAWALLRGYAADHGVVDAVEAASKREGDASARTGMQASLERLSRPGS